MRTSLLAIASITVGIPLLAMATRFDGGRSSVVDCDSKRPSIARVLDRARDGDTIEIRGACVESLVIDKSITLEGNGSASIAPSDPADITIQIAARDVTLRGLRLESPASRQVTLDAGASASLEFNTIRNASAFGVSVTGNSFLVLLGNEITQNTSGVVAAFGAGMRVGFRSANEPPTPNLIADNAGSGLTSGVGILVSDNATAQILGGNTISGNNVGIFVAQAGYSQIAGNEISGNQIGILSSTNAAILLPFADNPNPLFTALNSGENVRFGIACRGGSISGVSDGLAPAVRLPPTAPGTLGGPDSGLATFCSDTTQSLAPAPAN